MNGNHFSRGVNQSLRWGSSAERSKAGDKVNVHTVLR